jgi:hypothetical protein
MPKPLGFFILLISSRLSRVSLLYHFCYRAREKRSKCAAASRHQCSPRADASKNPLHLEDEAISIQEPEDQCREEEIP